MKKRVISSIFTVFIVIASLGITPGFTQAKPPSNSDPEATLSQCLELRTIDGVKVPFQHNRPYPSFEDQSGREYLDLAGTWKYLKASSSQAEIDASLNRRNGQTISQLESLGYHTVGFNDASWQDRIIPVCENPIGEPKDENVYWFRRNIFVPSSMEGKYVKLMLLGANYITDVWVNGKYVGWHEGGYTSFFFDVSKYLNYGANNLIAIRVHNIPWDSRSTYEDIVPYKTLDFRNYGGIFRDIYLEAANQLNIVRTDVKPSLKFQDGVLLTDSGHIDVNVVMYNHGASTENASVELSVYGTSVNDINILDPRPEAIVDLNNPINVTGFVSSSAEVPVIISMYQNFEEGNGTPGNYFEDVWQSNPTFESSVVHSGSRSLRISTGSGGGTVAILAASPYGYINLSSAISISVWVYDTQGNNTIQLRLRDNDGDGGSGDDKNYLWSSISSVQNQWTKITWYLNDYPDVDDLNLDRIAKIELYEWNQGVYYFDDLEYTINGTKVLTFSLDLSGISLWTPANPTLYVLKGNLNSGVENFYTQFGIREVKIDNENCRFLLNRIPTFLAGIARHESMPNVYRKFTENEMIALKTDFQNAKDANVNFIRTAHYANHPYAYLLADRMGMMIWEELVATWFSPTAYDVQRLRRGITTQMWLEMIYRDYNRPSIIIWSTTNEGEDQTQDLNLNKRHQFNQDLKNIAYQIDGTRLVSQAINGSYDTDPTLAGDDILGMNEYWGVFYGTTGEYYNQTKESIRRTNNAYPTKPILVSEMGTWSYQDLSRMAEQVKCWDNTYRALDEKPYVVGVTWWCLNDWWKADGSDQTMGTITWDRSTKKDVYYSIQTSYENTWTRPWVRILSPSDTSTLSENVVITAIAEDFRGTNIGISSVQYRIDSGSYVNMTYQGNSQWSATWNSTTVSDGAHTITVRATDNDGHTKIHLIDVTVNNKIMYIQSIEMSTVKARSLVNGRANVFIISVSGQPVGQATVYGHWSGLTSDTDQKATDSTGHAIIDSNKIRNPVGTFTFTVDNVVKNGWIYDSSRNVITENSIRYP